MKTITFEICDGEQMRAELQILLGRMSLITELIEHKPMSLALLLSFQSDASCYPDILVKLTLETIFFLSFDT